MKVVILTSMRRSTASRCIPAMCKNKAIQIERVILAGVVPPNRIRHINRKLKKVLKIGVLGAINGIRMRSWYEEENIEDIADVCSEYGIPLYETESINCELTRALFSESCADLGVSLGNTYISPNVFNIPKYGMINAHGEILPDYQNAQSIIWPIHDGKRETGITIHQVDSRIDTGDILYQENYEIKFMPTLEQTVRTNVAVTSLKAPDAVAYVCANYLELRKRAKAQVGGDSFTTPSIWQFYRMSRNNSKLFLEQT